MKPSPSTGRAPAPPREALALLKALVRTPSQAPGDRFGPVLEVASGWLASHGLAHERLALRRGARVEALVVNPPQSADEEVLLLDACIDTAPVGDCGAWSVDPFGAVVRDGWLYGRGSADSKAAVAIFSELARTEALAPGPAAPGRRVTLLFDADEHSGRFGGIERYLQRYGAPRHCAIGYPGLDEVVAGSRGFWRTVVTLRGAIEHSGAGTVPRERVMRKLAMLSAACDALSARKPQAGFPHGPRATLTAVHSESAPGVRGFSVTPGRIEANLDVRLTPRFDAAAAQAWLTSVLATIAAECGSEHACGHDTPASWPPYRTPDTALLPQLLLAGAQAVLGRPVPLAVSGPSNIGNRLAGLGTEVLCGFGVRFERAHGPDECIELASMAPVLATYRQVVRAYLAGAGLPG